MTPEQITLVQNSFRAVAPLRAASAAQFYANLFARDPAVAAMFSGTDLTAQGDKLMTALAMVVQGLTWPEQILPVVRELGRLHAGFGVKPAHYETVGAALLDTLAAGLGPSFTPETKLAWASAYGLLSKVMIDASSPSPPGEELSTATAA